MKRNLHNLKPALLYAYRAILNDSRAILEASVRKSGTSGLADKPHKRRFSVELRKGISRRGFSVSEWRIIKQVGGALLVLFLALAISFHNTPPIAIDNVGTHYDLIQISPLSSIQPVYSVFEAKEPVPLSNVSFTPGNDYTPLNCTWGVANWTRVPAGLGNASDWPSSAMAMGFSVTSTPTPGSVGVSMAGYYGHVVLVEQVGGTSADIVIREQNYDYAGSIRERPASPSEFQYYIVF